MYFCICLIPIIYMHFCACLIFVVFLILTRPKQQTMRGPFSRSARTPALAEVEEEVRDELQDIDRIRQTNRAEGIR